MSEERPTPGFARILIVDDDEDVAASLKALLETLPAVSCEVASDFVEGLERLRGQSWSLVLSDQRLPGGSGADLLREAAALRPPPGRMLITAYRQDEIDARTARDARIDVLLRKPWDDDVVLTKVEQLLGRQPRSAGGGAAGPGHRVARR